jgi:hypothetical protein
MVSSVANNNTNRYLTSYFDGLKSTIENYYDIYITYFEAYMTFWGKNREIYDKNKNHQVEMFNAYMTGYEKAKSDFGISTKEPSDIYF